MAYTTVNNQIFIQGKLPIDAKLTPVQDFQTIAAYDFYSDAYNGLEIIVINGGYPVRMMLIADEGASPKKYNWVISHPITVLDHDALVGESGLCHTIVDTLSTKKNVSRAFSVGQKAVVLSDETRGGKWSEYIVTGVTNGYPSWEYSHAEPGKFSLETNVSGTSIDLLYDGVKVGSAASLTEILTEWQSDQFITSGSVVEESGSTFIEMYYNDETIEPIRIDVSSLVGPQSAGTPFETGDGLILEDGILSVDSGYVRDIAISAITDSLIPSGASEALDTLTEIAEWIQSHPEEAIRLSESMSAVSGSLVSLTEAVEEGMRPSVSAETYTDAKDLATAENIGKIINVKNEEVISGTTYSEGLYIVTGSGELSKLGIASASGDIAGDVENLKGRVGTLETNVTNIMDYLYWETDDDLVIE